jgi:similar to stage IV sporulation protein
MRFKWLTLAAVLLSVVLAYLLSGLVWDVRIEGNQTVSPTMVSKALSECGLSVGKSWRKIDTSDTEARLLGAMSELSWVNINRRGTVAYVTVAERSPSEPPKVANGGYANLVAATDCVIEGITVKHGRAEVKVGDTVKKGDILISGILPEASGGGFTYAEGSVIGRISEEISVEVARQYEKTVKKTEKTVSLAIKLFDFKLNIFKNYRNLHNECVIIKEIGTYSLLGGATLPLVSEAEIAVIYEQIPTEYTDHELVSVATARLNSLVAARLSSAVLYKLRTDGSFTETGYRMSSNAVFAEEVGRVLEFSLE